MKTVIQGLMGFLTLALLSCVVASYPARAEISCVLNTLPENDVIDTDVGDDENHHSWGFLAMQWFPGHVRVMISTLHDEEYHKGEQWYKDAQGNPVLYDYQTEDKKAIISIEVWVPAEDSNPNGNDNQKKRHGEIVGCAVWILVIDPPDGSVYVKGTQDDNRDANTKRGNLSVAPNFTAEGDPITISWVVEGNQITKTVGLGVKLQYSRPETVVPRNWSVYHAKAILEITDRFAGDNYRILASVNQKPADSLLDAYKNPKSGRWSLYEWFCQPSGTMYAWKRCYLEVDKMFREGSYLRADAAAGQRQIQLQLVPDLAANDKIYIFERDYWDEDQWVEGDHEYAEIESVDTGTRTIIVKANLTNAYDKGVYIPNAAVGKLVGGGTLENCNQASTFYLADLSLLKSCYDPGFVEFKELPDGAGPLPYESDVGDPNNLIEGFRTYSQRYFKNREIRDEDQWIILEEEDPHPEQLATGKKNYFHIVMASDSVESGLIEGTAIYSTNATFIWVAIIEVLQEPTGRTACHEIGHQFNVCGRTYAHCTYRAYMDDRKCIMHNTPENSTFARFCLWHILHGFGTAPKNQPSLRNVKDGR